LLAGGLCEKTGVLFADGNEAGLFNCFKAVGKEGSEGDEALFGRRWKKARRIYPRASGSYKIPDRTA
jgi:hypothetical protein